MKNKTWFITGISSGLGKAIAQTAMECGDFVIGTFRKPEQTDEFNALHGSSGLAITLDVTEPSQIEHAFRVVSEKFGRLDVLVNNVGFGFAGAIEETGLDEARSVFEANFFGTLQVTQTFLPMFRQQKSGHIIQISSHGGFKAFAGFGIYNASKFALEGLSEALAQEISPLGIKLSIAEPGPFRTEFAGDAFRQADRHINDYAETAGAFRARIKAADGKQEGDPSKAAKAIYALANLEHPPLRLPLGKIAVASITAKLESVRADLEAARNTAESVVF